MECGKAPSSVRKMKKKQVKDESDRIKQAEKKKRRLEKALATSAAIISELEKKKQKKKEEQQRLDEEGAAIAEAVALQVLTGEDSDDTFSEVNYSQQVYNNPKEEFGWIMNANGGSICQWNGYGRGENGSFERSYVGEMSTAGLIAAQAVSSLHIADDEDISAFMFNRMVRG
ncbi:hypothetical protein HanPI659440_Chr09g0332731 [Helianthus annuus]|nr:hypothetical protein HanPI659440_Chr09g0332731 [Helianthus annuus]